MTRSLALASLALSMLVPLRAHALGDRALIFHAPSALTVSYGGLAAELQGAGAAQVDEVGSWPGGDLASQYRLIVITPWDGPLDASIVPDVAAFVAAGGGLVVMAEHDFGIDAGNELATALGLGARFVPVDTGPGCSGTDVAPSAAAHPLTAEAPTLEFAWSSTIEGGTLLYGTVAPVAAVERTVVMVGDSDVFSDPVAFGGCGVGPSTFRFYRNLFTSLPDEGGSMTIGDGGAPAADAGVGGSLGAACATGTDCASGLCVTIDDRQLCSERCTLSCPSGYTCEPIGGGEALCAPSTGRGGGCAIGPSGRRASTSPLALVALAALAWGTRRRRRA